MLRLHELECFQRPMKPMELFLVPGAGIEPALAEANEILSLACLPISPPGQVGAGWKLRSLTSLMLTHNVDKTGAVKVR